ncbi:MAG TPA: phospholipid scramblase-related protein [Armatimonadota bacterium]|nr:phospholipid scramblase-related protein [Armatimonadota bacterium]
MADLFAEDVLLVKEQVGYFKAANAYDVFTPTTGMQVAAIREQVPNILFKLLKFTDNKTLLPFTVDILDDNSMKLLTLKRPFTLFRSRVTIYDALGQKVGAFQQRFSLGGKFDIYDAQDQQVARLQGDWKGWNFSLVGMDGQPMAAVTKKWAGLGKELLTSADNYVVSVQPTLTDEQLRRIVVAAAICIDMVLKEGGR